MKGDHRNGLPVRCQACREASVEERRLTKLSRSWPLAERYHLRELAYRIRETEPETAAELYRSLVIVHYVERWR